MEAKYIDVAARILTALENGKVPITWHEMRRAELELEIAQELRRMDKEENRGQPEINGDSIGNGTLRFYNS